MHIFFSGIGGAGIGPLALIAKQAGYEVSGSDKQDSSYIDYLRQHGIADISVGQTADSISRLNSQKPIDWLVFSSAVIKEQPDHPEILFAKQNSIKLSKRDEFLSQFVDDNKLKMIAIAGTHGKTTTTSMVIWLFKQLGVPISYSVGAKLSFGDIGHFEPGSEYFVYEADEYDRNFLAYHPEISLITGVTWDHHEIFPTRENYREAFRRFISQSKKTIVWDQDNQALDLKQDQLVKILDSNSVSLDIKLHGETNRLDAELAAQGVLQTGDYDKNDLYKVINDFPGLYRRMEQIIPNLYSDYAHTPEKVRGGLGVALDMAKETGQKVIVVFEPLHNRRQHYMIDEYQDSFKGAEKLYWIPSYLAREDPNQRIIEPAEMIEHLSDPSIGVPMNRDVKLKQAIQKHLKQNDMVVCMAGGGGDSLDEWLRAEFAS